MIRKKIPNIITLINLFCGCGALVSVFNQEFIPAFFFLMIGGIADYTDGLVARALGVNSPLGKEMDSLADMVSFGVVPGAIVYQLLVFAWNGETATGTLEWKAMPGFLISVFAGLRLAKFNLDTRQSTNFFGLNTPSCTMFITGLMLIYEFDSLGMRDWVIQPYFLYAVAVLFSYLMVSDIPMFGFKFKQYGWQGNEHRYSFLVLALILLIVFQEVAFSVIVLLYILYSIILLLFKKDKHEVLSRN